MSDAWVSAVVIVLALALGSVVVRFGRDPQVSDSQIEDQARFLYYARLHELGAVHVVPWEDLSQDERDGWRSEARERILAASRASGS